MSDIKQTVTVDDKASQPLRDIADKTRAMADATREAGQAAKQTNDAQHDLAGSTAAAERETLKAAAAQRNISESLALAEQGLEAATKLWSDYRASIDAATESLKRNAEASRASAEARLDLAALNGMEKESDLQLIRDASVTSGRSPGEVAGVLTTIKGAFPAGSDAQHRALMMEVSAKAQQTSSPMSAIAQPMVLMLQNTGDARVSSNIMEAMFDQAQEANPAKVSELAGKFIGKGRSIGGLSTGEAAGYVAGATGLGIPGDVAITSMTRAVLGIRGEGTTEGAKILAREGINRENLSEAVKGISAAFQGGRITRQELEQIGGAEALDFLTAMTDPAKLKDFYSRVDAVAAAENYDGHFISEKSKRIFGSSPAQAANLAAKQFESSAAITRGNDLNAMKATSVRSALEAVLAKGQAAGLVTPLDVKKKLEAYDEEIAKGSDPIVAAERAEFWGSSGSSNGPMGRSGVELGAAAYEALQLGPSIDPSRQLNIKPVRAGGRSNYLEIDAADRAQLGDPAPIISQDDFFFGRGTTYNNCTFHGQPPASVPSYPKID